MRLNPVYSAVLREPWAIDPVAAEAYLPLVLQMMERNSQQQASEPEEKPVVRSFAVCMVEGLSTENNVFTSSFSSYDEAPAGSIAIHKVEGPMMTEDFCGSPGTASLGAWIREADEHGNIAAHLVHFKSPGGTVSGTERFAGIISETKKPLVAFAEMMCSAAFWSGSGANLIIAAGQTAMVGSIGTMTTLTDYSSYYEKLGIKTHTIRATESKDKNEPHLQALKGKYELMQKQQLDPLNKAFTSSVKVNRDGKLDLEAENVLTGKVYIGQDIVTFGLADEVGTFEYAVRRATELANQETDHTQSETNSNSINNMFGKNKFKAVFALAGKKGEELTAELLEAANEELEANGIEGAALITEAQHAAYEASAQNEAKLTKDLETANAALVEANAKISKLEKKPAASSTNPSKEGVEMKDETTPDENARIIAELPHNKAIADNPLYN